MNAFMDWIVSTPASRLINDFTWAWPIAETLHFIGLALMAGTVGAFDLRLLGVGRGIAPAALHRLIRWGVLGFAISVITGVLFISGAPDQYFYNSAFHLKAIGLVLMGLNVVAFYTWEFGRVRTLGPDESAPPAAKLMAGTSLLLIAAVMLCGRMLTFFRPPPLY